MIDIEKIKRDGKNLIPASVRITKDDKEFLEKNNIHLGKFMREAIKDFRQNLNSKQEVKNE